MDTLDLNSTVTRDQYIASINGLCEYLNELSRYMGWCGERHRYFAAIIPEYHYDRYDHVLNVDFDTIPEDADYAARLRSVRARVLWYVNAGTTDLESANAGFRAGGLPEYVHPSEENKSGQRMQVYLPELFLNVANNADGNAHDAYDWLHANIVNLVIAALDGREFPNSRYVPGSVEIQGRPDVYTVTPPRASIPEDQTERPSYL